jgi:hypothetical protein
VLPNTDSAWQQVRSGTNPSFGEIGSGTRDAFGITDGVPCQSAFRRTLQPGQAAALAERAGLLHAAGPAGPGPKAPSAQT